jgi:hypothetical protein
MPEIGKLPAEITTGFTVIENQIADFTWELSSVPPNAGRFLNPVLFSVSRKRSHKYRFFTVSICAIGYAACIGTAAGRQRPTNAGISFKENDITRQRIQYITAFQGFFRDKAGICIIPFLRVNVIGMHIYLLQWMRYAGDQ